MVALAKELSIGLVVVGPDEDVVAGIEGFFRRGNTTPFPLSSGVQVVSITASSPSDSPPTENIPCFAPTKEAAELEGSKAFAKDFMRRHGIPTAQYQTFDDVAVAKDYVRRVNYPVVIKASGLAAGKGVVLPQTKDEACEALDDMMVREQFGGAGSSVVVEELLAGQEISVLTFSDGKRTKTLPPGQDHKRVFEGNKGPNTGGMGVFAPTGFVSDAEMEVIEDTIPRPTFEGLRAEGKFTTHVAISREVCFAE